MFGLRTWHEWVSLAVGICQIEFGFWQISLKFREIGRDFLAFHSSQCTNSMPQKASKYSWFDLLAGPSKICHLSLRKLCHSISEIISQLRRDTDPDASACRFSVHTNEQLAFTKMTSITLLGQRPGAAVVAPS